MEKRDNNGFQTIPCTDVRRYQISQTNTTFPDKVEQDYCHITAYFPDGAWKSGSFTSPKSFSHFSR